ncbi:MAG: hypothetical protein ABSH06_17790 [Thermodesulfobacteriota bacterium]
MENGVELKTDQPTDMGRHAALVATGILLSRITGLIRDRVFAHYLGNPEAADAFRAAFRIPNFLQMRYAILRVFLTTVLGYIFALPLPALLGLDPRWGVAGLTVSAGVCGWLELLLLRNSMKRRIGKTGLPAPFVLKLWISAGAAAACTGHCISGNVWCCLFCCGDHVPPAGGARTDS